MATIRRELKPAYNQLKQVKDTIKKTSSNSLFCTSYALTSLTKCLEILDPVESGCRLENAFHVFQDQSLWWTSADSINCLLDFGLVHDCNFFASFLQFSKNDTWGNCIKTALLAKKVAGKQDFVTSDFVLNQISDSMIQIRKNIQLLLTLRQAKTTKESVDKFETQSFPRLKFEQLFNQRSKKVRAITLLEIVQEFDLFTSCFPILFCTPKVASTLFQRYSRIF